MSEPVVVPTRATRVIARQIITETPASGADAVLRHLPDVDPDQIPALVALLAKAVISGERPSLIGAGQPEKPLLLAEDERRRAHARYANGMRDQATVRGEREYQRAHKRGARKVA